MPNPLNNDLDPDVIAQIAAQFKEDDHTLVAEILGRYRRNEAGHVQLGILKLSESDVAAVRLNTWYALQDYRDILYWAFHPSEQKVIEDQVTLRATETDIEPLKQIAPIVKLWADNKSIFAEKDLRAATITVYESGVWVRCWELDTTQYMLKYGDSVPRFNQPFEDFPSTVAAIIDWLKGD